MHKPGCQKNGAFNIGIQKNRVIHILFVEKGGPIIYLAALKKGAIRHAHQYYAIYRKLPPPPPPRDRLAYKVGNKKNAHQKCHYYGSIYRYLSKQWFCFIMAGIIFWRDFAIFSHFFARNRIKIPGVRKKIAR